MKIRNFILCIISHIAHAQMLLQDDPTALLDTMSLDEKIGQLFMVAAISDTALNTAFLEHAPYQMDHDYVRSLITQYHIGGIIFLGSGTIQSQINLTRQFQSISKIPLLIGQDCEWGLAMRIRDTIKFPYALTLGAIQDNTLIQLAGNMIGTQCAAMGVHINFAPVADVNTYQGNPVIGSRSFGADATQVAQKSVAFMRGLQAAGTIACAKHFPGHGDTTTDSHYGLPIIAHALNRLTQVELYPFKQLIGADIPALMTGHVAVPALDNTQTPASMSYPITTEFLQHRLGFTGLVITDGLGMQAVTTNKAPGQPELAALMAGNDILLCPVDVPAACRLIKEALADGRLSQEIVDAHVLKMLQTKQQIHTDTPLSFDDITAVIHSTAADELNRELFHAAITIPCDVQNCIPIAPKTSIIHLEIGTHHPTHVAQLLAHQYPVTYTAIDLSTNLYQQLPAMPPDMPLIITVHGTSRYARDRYGISTQVANQITDLCRTHPHTILVLFASPYSVSFFQDAPCIICAYEDEHAAHGATVDIITGNKLAVGKMPI